MTMETQTIKAMTSQELTRKILNNEELFILDVRNISFSVKGGELCIGLGSY